MELLPPGAVSCQDYETPPQVPLSPFHQPEPTFTVPPPASYQPPAAAKPQPVTHADPYVVQQVGGK